MKNIFHALIFYALFQCNETKPSLFWLTSAFPFCYLHFENFHSSYSNLEYTRSGIVQLLGNSGDDFKPHYPRFGLSCKIKLFWMGDVVSEDYSNMLNLVQDGSTISENPDYIVFFHTAPLEDISSVQEEALFHFIESLKFITVTSKYLFLTDQNLYIINLMADDVKKGSLNRCDHTKVSEISSIVSRKWDSLTANFQKLPVLVPKLSISYLLLSFYGEECNYLGLKFAGSEQFCSIRILEAAMNFTVIEKEDPENVGGPVIGKIISDIFSLIIQEKENDPEYIIELLAAGQKTVPFGFAIILNRDSLQLTNPSKAFDIPTWCCSIIAATLISVLVTSLDDRVMNTFENLALSHFLVFCILFEQSPAEFFQNSIKNQNANTNTSRILMLKIALSVWMLLSIVLCGGYKGVFYSFLTTGTQPPIPSTLEELIDSDQYTMIALDSLPLDGFDGKWISIFSLLVMQYTLVLKTTPNVTPRMLLRGARYQEALDKIIITQKLTYGRIKMCHDFRIKIDKPFVDNDGLLIPRDFAAISSTEGIEHFTSLMKLATLSGHRYFVLRSKTFDNFLSGTELHAVTRNFFRTNFRAKFSALVESGIYWEWRKYSTALKLKLDSYLIECMEKLYAMGDITRIFDQTACQPGIGKLEDTLFKNVPYHRPKIQSSSVIAKPLSMNVVLIVFIMWVVGLFMGLLGKVAEIYRHHRRGVQTLPNASNVHDDYSEIVW